MFRVLKSSADNPFFPTRKLSLVIAPDLTISDVVLQYIYKSAIKFAVNEKCFNQNIQRLVTWLNFLNQQLVCGIGGASDEVKLFSFDEIIFLASDDIIKEYKDHLENELKLSEANYNLYISVIYDFYWVSRAYKPVELGNRTFSVPTNIIGWADLVNGTSSYPISVYKSAKSSKGYKIPFLKTLNKTPQLIPTPSEYIDAMHKLVHLASKKRRFIDYIIDRDLLIIRWVCEACLRRTECSSLNIDLVLNAKLSYANGMYKIRVENGTKYGKPRIVKISQDLYHATTDFIKITRDEYLEFLVAGGKVYNADSLFLSSSNATLGKRLSPDGIYSILKKCSDFPPHAWRRCGLTMYALLITLLQKKLAKIKKTEEERSGLDLLSLQSQLQEQAGHTSFDTTLNSYLNTALLQSNFDNIDESIEQLECFQKEMLGNLAADFCGGLSGFKQIKNALHYGKA